jgi:hypothetical protein
MDNLRPFSNTLQLTIIIILIINSFINADQQIDFKIYSL